MATTELDRLRAMADEITGLRDEIKDLYALLAECRVTLRDYGYDDTELYARLVRTEAMTSDSLQWWIVQDDRRWEFP